jgi:hypothetical protein
MTKENSKYDTANISYVERGGASAMFITRDDQDKRYYRMNGSTYYGVLPAGFLPRRTSTNTKKKAVIQDASADKRPAISTKPKIKYDAAYISYVENGESAAVFITRDIAQEVPTDKRWIDVISLDGYKRSDGRWVFNMFTVEMFPRKLRPKYPDNISDEDKKYTTWKTAHEDIENQRRNGVKGTKYSIWPKLVDRNQAKGKKPKWEYEIVEAKRL